MTTTEASASQETTTEWQEDPPAYYELVMQRNSLREEIAAAQKTHRVARRAAEEIMEDTEIFNEEDFRSTDKIIADMRAALQRAEQQGAELEDEREGLVTERDGLEVELQGDHGHLTELEASGLSVLELVVREATSSRPPDSARLWVDYLQMMEATQRLRRNASQYEQATSNTTRKVEMLQRKSAAQRARIAEEVAMEDPHAAERKRLTEAIVVARKCLGRITGGQGDVDVLKDEVDHPSSSNQTVEPVQEEKSTATKKKSSDTSTTSPTAADNSNNNAEGTSQPSSVSKSEESHETSPEPEPQPAPQPHPAAQ